MMEEKRNPNAAESEAILMLLAIASELHEYEPMISKRLDEIPNGKKNWRWARSVLTNMIKPIFDTLPEGKARYFRKMIDKMQIQLKFNGKTASLAGDHEWALVHTEDLTSLVTGARDKCLICIDGNCNTCALGKALDNVLTENRQKTETWNDVWYRSTDSE